MTHVCEQKCGFSEILFNFLIKITFMKVVLSEIFYLDVINLRHMKQDLNHNRCVFMNICG